MRVVFVEGRKHWWWNAWRAATATELYGFTDSQPEAWQAMEEAITAARVPDQLCQRRTRPRPRP